MRARRSLTLILILSTFSVGAVGVVSGLIAYRGALDSEADALQTILSIEANIFRAFYDHEEREHAGADSTLILDAAVADLRASDIDFNGFGVSGELTVARREGDMIHFLLRQRGSATDFPDPVPWTGGLAEPMRRALSGRLGVEQLVDYAGTPVMAAYRSIPGTPLGMVAKKELSEIRGRYLRGAVLGGALGLTILIVGVGLIRRLGGGLVEEAEEHESQHRAFLESFPGAAFRLAKVAGEGWRYRSLEGHVEELTGWPAAHFLDDPEAWPAAVPVEERAKARLEVLAELALEVGQAEVEYRVLHRSGELRWIRTILHPAGEGHEEELVGLHSDVSPRRQLDAALRVRERELASLVANLPRAAVHLLDRDLRFLRSGGGALARVGLKADELEGHDASEIVPPEWFAVVRKQSARVLAGETIRFDMEFRGHHFLVTAAPLGGVSDAVERILVVALDVTEEERQERALREREAFIRTAMDNLPIGVAINSTVLPLEFSYINENFLRFYRTTREALEEPDGFWEAVYEDPEFRRKMKDRIVADVTSGDPEREHWEDIPIAREGEETTWVSAKNVVLPGGDEVISTVWDVTERKRAQDALNELTESLERKVEDRTRKLAEANKELESFAYTVSHDLKAPLRAIDGYSALLVERSHDALDPESRQLLQEVRYNAQHMGQLIEDLLTLSRVGRATLTGEDLDLRALVEELVEQERRLAPDRVIELVADDLPTLRVDRTLFRHAFANLIANAVKFTRPRAVARIEVSAARVGGQLEISVRDNGVGFDPEYQHKLFALFERLHYPDEFEGTGVGLAIVKRIAERHGGSVSAEGAVDEGAVFRIRVPQSKGGRHA